MLKHHIIFLAFFAFSYVYAQCDSTTGFLTEVPVSNPWDETYFINLTKIYNLTEVFTYEESPLVLVLLEEENINVTAALSTGGNAGVWNSWSINSNGIIDQINVFGDSSNFNDNESVVLHFDPPVNAVVMKTNYDPNFLTSDWGAPTFALLDTEGAVQSCYRIDVLGPISFTPSTTNGYEYRGVSGSSISALRLDSGRIVGWDITILRNGQPPQAAAPVEPPMDAPVAVPQAAGPVATPVKPNTPTKKSDSNNVVSSALAFLTAALFLV